MWSDRILMLLLAITAEVAYGQGSYWAIYNATVAPATNSCLVDEGMTVDEACCKDAGQTLPHAALQGNDTCFVLGPGLIPFSGCVGDGVYGYGENCAGEGAPFVAENAEACGCDFVIEGSGCYKANDIPGQHWFVFLDGESCKTMTNATDAPEAAPTVAPTEHDHSAHTDGPTVAPTEHDHSAHTDGPTGAPVAAPSGAYDLTRTISVVALWLACALIL